MTACKKEMNSSGLTEWQALQTKTAHLGCLMAHFTEAQATSYVHKKPIEGTTEIWVLEKQTLKQHQLP